MGNLFSYYTQILFLTLIIINHLWEIYLARRQANFLTKNRFRIPEMFSKEITPDDHQKSTLYANDKLRMTQVKLIYQLSLYLYWFPFRGAESLYMNVSNFTLTGDAIFLVSFVFIQSLLSLPFSYISTFFIEKKYGFNRTTHKLFFTDLLKGLLLSSVILIPLLFAVLLTMSYFKNAWWIISFAILTIFQLVMLWIYPSFIAPMFNKFSPLSEGPLKDRIEKLLEEVGFHAEGIFVMDASRRSTHGNAYFTGFGKNKRVVFFDTLLDKLNDDEIIAVLAHELGHLKLKHIPKQIGISLVLSFLGFLAMYLLSRVDWFYTGHFMRITSNGVLLFIFAFAASFYTFWFSPLSSIFSRKNEFEADAFACKYAKAQDLKQALTLLYKFNASPVESDPWYVFFYYSHPTPTERFKRLN